MTPFSSFKMQGLVLFSVFYLLTTALTPAHAQNIEPRWCTPDEGIGLLQGYVGLEGISLGTAVVGVRQADGSIRNFTLNTNVPDANFLEYKPGPPQTAELISAPTLTVEPRGETPLDYTRLAASTTNRNNVTSLAAGDYRNVTLNNNAVLAGGTYYINNLELNGNNNTFTFRSGNYYIGDFKFRNGARIQIDGDVTFHIGRSFGEDFHPNNNLNLNGNAPSPDNFIMILYNNGGSPTVFRAKNNANVKGLIYSDSSNTLVDLQNNSVFEGGVIIAGEIDIDEGSTIIINNSVFGLGNVPTPTPGNCLDHLQIIHPQEVVSCTAAPVRVIACADEDCTERYTDPFDIRLNSSASTSLWRGVTGRNPYNLRMTAGEQTVQLANVSGGSTTISSLFWNATTGSYTAAPDDVENPVRCAVGSSASSCNVNFVESGLVITGGNESDLISPAPAGSDFNTYLWAIRTDSETRACVPTLKDTTRTVNLGLRCIDSDTCSSGVNYQVNDTAINRVNANQNFNYSPVVVEFDSTGRAPLSNNYHDVGQFQMGAFLQLESPPGEASPDNPDPTLSIFGQTIQDYVIHPASFSIHALQGSVVRTETESAFIPAGTEFDVVIQGRSATGQLTPNFGRESVATNWSLSHQLLAPLPNGIPGTVTGPTSYVVDANFPGAVRGNNVTWSEVGVLGLSVALTDNLYLNEVISYSTTPSAVGRFYPADFVIVNTEILNGCGDFTYMGQEDIEVNFTLQALNTAGDRTQNYTAGYPNKAEARLIAANVSPADTAENDFAGRLQLFNGSAWEPAPVFSGWNAGELSVAGAQLRFARLPNDIVDGPYDTTYIGLQMTDPAEGNNFDYADRLDNDPDSVLTTAQGTQAVRVGSALDALKIRYGRLSLENIFGPENEDLPVLMRTEYWNGNRFAISFTDSCTNFELSNLTRLPVDWDDAIEPAPAGRHNNGFVENGQLVHGDLYWVAPMEIGSFLFTYDAPEWLMFRWNSDIDEAINPTAIGEMGRFRSYDRILFRR